MCCSYSTDLTHLGFDDRDEIFERHLSIIIISEVSVYPIIFIFYFLWLCVRYWLYRHIPLVVLRARESCFHCNLALQDIHMIRYIKMYLIVAHCEPLVIKSTVFLCVIVAIIFVLQIIIIIRSEIIFIVTFRVVKHWYVLYIYCCVMMTIMVYSRLVERLSS